ncbi:uncharacterized protein PHALS_10746 [Plasmopara halstedii]|uniref:Uncharacterized protein n=1 Tax=Plasmopara halstedii TaxID=4781 RepID=A0A0P1AIH7_PLAHL|nr:uncharacterized protein PHALS_10746 [Plasmopara halstedii]CEG40556.1 hypothetical protein PHALS_10746 [Plasmopara halstedii]|eukprot:XP_024576925.1 hypothetical protein PHALS_10746 [Plasmopara halstedii]
MAKKGADARHHAIVELKDENVNRLSSSIKCEASVMHLLSPATIELANYVVKYLDEEDPGIFVQIIDQIALHDALTLPNSPISQGIDADESTKAFRGWLINGAWNVRANSQVCQNSTFSLAFHQLTQGDALNIVLGQWLQQRWNTQMQDHQIETFAIVFWMAGTGPRRATFTTHQNIFGLI